MSDSEETPTTPISENWVAGMGARRFDPAVNLETTKEDWIHFCNEAAMILDYPKPKPLEVLIDPEAIGKGKTWSLAKDRRLGLALRLLKAFEEKDHRLFERVAKRLEVIRYEKSMPEVDPVAEGFTKAIKQAERHKLATLSRSIRDRTAEAKQCEPTKADIKEAMDFVRDSDVPYSKGGWRKWFKRMGLLAFPQKGRKK